MELGISGKRALVCAASKGLGKAIAISLAKEGVKLAICARNTDRLGAVANTIEELTGERPLVLPCDLSQQASLNSLIQTIEKEWGGLDILVHNTGGPTPTVVEETTDIDWQTGFEQLFLSVTRLNQAFLPGMKARQWGRILIVTSTAVTGPIANLAVSNAVRAAVTGMAKTLSDEIALSGVTVNCVAPGVIYTDRTEDRINAELARHGGTREQYLAKYAASIPMGRLGRPDEFADAVTFLASQQASYITGVTFCVDGGKRRAPF